MHLAAVSPPACSLTRLPLGAGKVHRSDLRPDGKLAWSDSDVWVRLLPPVSAEIGKPVPLLANMRPHGHFHMSDLSKIGGVPIVMKELLSAGMIHGDAMTCTGKTVAENLATYPSLSELTQSVVTPVAEPFSAAGNHITVIQVGPTPEQPRPRTLPS